MIKFNKLKKPYIIAEIGINHEGSYGLAKKLILEAKKAGASAVKFQVFKPATLAPENIRKTKLQKKSSGKESLTNIWKRVCLSRQSLMKLRFFAKYIGIDFICTAFDFESLALVKKLNVDVLKIASSDITDIPLLIEISKLKKPIIISTGMSNDREITKALNTINKKNISILHCVSLYPCEFRRANLKRILAIKKKYKEYIIGYSDHCKNIEASILAINLGAKIIEKHFTLDKKKIGLDHSLSADPFDLKIICDYAKNFNLLLGSKKIIPSSYERNFKKLFRKGIYFKKTINKDEVITKEHLIICRPENSTRPEFYNFIIGKKTKKKMNFLTAVHLKNLY
jgi:N,N'-diacetyllegionaminate synthase